jgi:hypothetical protein
MSNFNILAAGMIVFFVAPWVAAFIRIKVKKPQRNYLIYYRYFVLMNVFLTSILVGIRLMFESAVPISNYSPALQSLTIQYGSMIMLVGILSAISVMQNNIIKLVPSLSWAPMLVIAAILDMVSIWHQPQLAHTTLILHVINNLVVAATLFMLAAVVYKKERRIITCFAGSAESM